MSDISVVICAYSEDRWPWLEQAVESVRLQTKAASEIVIVVDHNPALLQRAQAGLPGTRAIENGQARGVSGSRNAGLAASSGAIVAFMDDDAVAEPEWLEQLASGYEDPTVLGVGGRLEPMWESHQPAWFPSEFGWVVGCSYVGLPKSKAPVRNMIGANMSVRRDVAEELGGFRVGFGKVGTQSEPEETDFCIRGLQRWRQANWLYEPLAIVHHRVPASRAHWRYFIWRCYLEGLGKANLVRHVGLHDGLAAEREYLWRVLPAGVWRGLVEASRGDLAGLARSAAIVWGLVSVMGGYALGIGLRRQKPGGLAAMPAHTALE